MRQRLPGRARDLPILPRQGEVAGPSLTEGEESETAVAHPPLRRLRSHLPLAGEDR
ncbi:conserved hypothetical protein [Sphingomonas aurantiaca]|uniref:Uncharacterized protein n=1 Tax=Sphingomonas aurantiaca TaxID=185949 RepID=A0A5E7ZWD6_9SPHN|nr:conserved hypothetical protein [Sphingomonas aurantiaca]